MRKNSVSIFPNPAASYANLIVADEKVSIESIKNITIYNTLGNKVVSVWGEGKEFIIKTDQLGDGVYFYTLTSGNQLIGSDKFMISNR